MVEGGRFAARTSWERHDPLGDAVPSGAVDLTRSNPTRVALELDDDAVRVALDAAWSATYEPEPFGARRAREAMAEHLGGHVEGWWLTASTSEAYACLIRLLCDAGTRVLCPSPSYPLLDVLADLADVGLDRYPLLEEDDGRIDLERLASMVTPAHRVLVVVSPNNPCGSVVEPEDLAAVAALCRRHDLTLVADQVFVDYGLAAPAPAIAWRPELDGVLWFVLGGLSKAAALPGLKLAWTAMGGPRAVLTEARSRLEVIADTFLSVATPVQRALPALLALAPARRARVVERLDQPSTARRARRNRRPARPSPAGWSQVLHVPATGSDEELVHALVRPGGVRLHPGSFYGYAERGRLVASLLGPTAELEVGLGRLVAALALDVG